MEGQATGNLDSTPDGGIQQRFPKLQHLVCVPQRFGPRDSKGTGYFTLALLIYSIGMNNS
jgi:hypothetical protein